MNEEDQYSKKLPAPIAKICDVLRMEINEILKDADSRLYYKMPVCFIDDNPILGYKATRGGVTLLFWSGQSFEEKDLKSAGKYKATKVLFGSVGDMDLTALRRWIEKSKKFIWDYRNIVKNGKLVLIHK